MEIRSAKAFVAYFDSVRGRTRRVAERVPADRLEWSPGPGRFTPGDLIRHIAATERWMWAENALLKPSRYPGHGPGLANGKDAVLAYLDRMHAETVEIISGLTKEQLSEKCMTVGGLEITVWKWLRAMIEHEVHHRGQLYGLLAQMGVETPPLYGLTEPEVRARSV